MPIRKPQSERKQSTLLKSYLSLIGENTAALARHAGVSRSRIYDALGSGALGHENARKIASHIARRLKLSEREELELRAELLGTPENLVRAYLGTRMETADLLGIDPDNAGSVLEPEGRIYHGAGTRAVEKLEEMGAPKYVTASVRERTLPPAGHRMGRGRFPEAEVRQSRRGPRKATLEETKPRLAAALEKSGIGLAELRERTGLGRETIRHALYGQGGAKSAEAIALVLAEGLGLTEEQMALIAWEVIRPPKHS